MEKQELKENIRKAMEKIRLACEEMLDAEIKYAVSTGNTTYAKGKRFAIVPKHNDDGLRSPYTCEDCYFGKNRLDCTGMRCYLELGGNDSSMMIFAEIEADE